MGLAGRIACEYGGLTGFGFGHAGVCVSKEKFATVAFFIHQFMLLDGALGGNTA